MIIIDEVQRIRGDEESKLIIEVLEYIIKYSNLKLILLSATPMYNQSDEIVTLLNLLLLNDNRATIPMSFLGRIFNQRRETNINR